MKKQRSIPVMALLASLTTNRALETGVVAPAPVATPGQITCYDDSGTVISCDIPAGGAFYGQDGQLRKGVAWPRPRFIGLVNPADDSGAGGGTAGNGVCNDTEPCNGVVWDRLTDLRWLRNADCFGDITDWKTALQKTFLLATGKCGLRDGSKRGSGPFLDHMNTGLESEHGG